MNSYIHPLYLTVVTHDLNRNLIMTRSANVIDDSTILHEGTNRLTYFVAQASFEQVFAGEEVIAIGEGS
jgi:ABC-type transporter Mla maintaining outer membrane lipid asymmetry ATPase subunit MlaF